MEAAGGVGKNFTVEDKNVLVNGSTLEINLYWAGKGTTAVPDRGVYGPLISAITVTPSKFFLALLNGFSPLLDFMYNFFQLKSMIIFARL